MTKQKKVLINSMPSKCMYCGSKKYKRDSDNSCDRLLPNGNLVTHGLVLCSMCDQTYGRTDIFQFEEVKSGQGKSRGSGVCKEDGKKSS